MLQPALHDTPASTGFRESQSHRKRNCSTRLDQSECEVLLADYLPFAEVAALPVTLPELPVRCRDRDNVVFLHLAIASGADLLVSGDADLTDLAAAYPVCSPAELRSRLERQA